MERKYPFSFRHQAKLGSGANPDPFFSRRDTVQKKKFIKNEILIRFLNIKISK